MPRRVLGLLALATVLAPAADLHLEGAVTVGGNFTKKLEGYLYVRGRVNTADGNLYDVSAAPILSYRLHPAVAVSGGSFFTNSDEEIVGRTMLYRPFAAIEPTIQRKSVELSARSRIERFIITKGVEDFTRFRERIQIARNGQWTPYAYTEFYFTAEGFTHVRYSGGVERALGDNNSIEFAYFYESSKLLEGGLRHMIRTTLHFNAVSPRRAD